jgi:hypothetical protein
MAPVAEKGDKAVVCLLPHPFSVFLLIAVGCNAHSVLAAVLAVVVLGEIGERLALPAGRFGDHLKNKYPMMYPAAKQTANINT